MNNPRDIDKIAALLRMTIPASPTADLVPAVMGEIRRTQLPFWRIFPWAVPALGALALVMGLTINGAIGPSYSTERLLSETVSADEAWLVSSQPPAGTVLLTNYYGGESRDR